MQKSFQKLEQDHHTEMRLFENERKQNEILKKKCDEQSNVLIEAKKENAVLFQQVQDLCEKISILMEQNKMLINDKLVLSQEKVMLLAQLKQESINV